MILGVEGPSPFLSMSFASRFTRPAGLPPPAVGHICKRGTDMSHGQHAGHAGSEHSSRRAPLPHAPDPYDLQPADDSGGEGAAAAAARRASGTGFVVATGRAVPYIAQHAP